MIITKKSTIEKSAKKPPKKAVEKLEKKTEEVLKKEPKKEPEKELEKELFKDDKYYEGLGRRKTAIARVRLYTKGEKVFLINGKPIENYFCILQCQMVVKSALETMNCLDKFRITALVKGGGLSAQAGAIRHAISRALILFNPDFRKRLKRAGFLKRDPRMRERKKFGLKRARRAPQWSKR